MAFRGMTHRSFPTISTSSDPSRGRLISLKEVIIMIKFIIKKFIPDFENVKNPQIRVRYGVLGGVLGIILNSFLFLIKLIAGLTSNSLAMISDAFNNLSDMGSSAVSVFGTKLSGRKADLDHPYGHGRGEYISALIVAILIMMVSLEIFKSAITKIINPEPVSINLLAVILLIASLLVKLWMWHYNRYMGKAINSGILIAAAKDSIGDVVATSVVLVSAVIDGFVDFPVDGIMGIVVSCLIFYSGYQIAKDTIDRLLGRNPEREIRDHIEKAVLENDIVQGMHDLMVHDYGPGRIIASVHAEVSKDLSLVECHDVIDKIEKRILKEFNIDIVIHMDPI